MQRTIFNSFIINYDDDDDDDDDDYELFTLIQNITFTNFLTSIVGAVNKGWWEGYVKRN